MEIKIFHSHHRGEAPAGIATLLMQQKMMVQGNPSAGSPWQNHMPTNNAFKVVLETIFGKNANIETQPRVGTWLGEPEPSFETTINVPTPANVTEQTIRAIGAMMAVFADRPQQAVFVCVDQAMLQPDGEMPEAMYEHQFMHETAEDALLCIETLGSRYNVQGATIWFDPYARIFRVSVIDTDASMTDNNPSWRLDFEAGKLGAYLVGSPLACFFIKPEWPEDAE